MAEDLTRAGAPRASVRSHFFINRNFGLLWSGQTISTLGDYIFNVSLILWIGASLLRGQSWAPLAVAGVIVSTTLATVLTGSLAGVFVDRWDKRRVMLYMDAARAALNLALLVVTTGTLAFPGGTWMPSQTTKVAVAYGCVFLATACTQFFQPATMSVLSSIVPQESLMQATGRQESTRGLAVVLGPSLATPIYLAWGIQWALLINAISFAVSFVSILAIRIPSATADAVALVEGSERTSWWREFADGVRFYAGNRTLTTLLVSGLLFILGVSALNALNLFFVTDNLHAAAATYGLLNGALGVGALIGGAFAAAYASRLRASRLFWLALLTEGLLILIYARLTTFPLALVVFGLIGIPNAVVNLALKPLLLGATPRQYIGRVVGLLMPTLSIGSGLSALIAGALESGPLRYLHVKIGSVELGPFDSVFTVVGLLSLLAALYARRYLASEQNSAAPTKAAVAVTPGRPE